MSKEHGIHRVKADQLYKAQEDIMRFFKDLVPTHLQKGFKELSLKHYKSLAMDVYHQKEALNISHRGVSRNVFKANLEKYIEDSKKLIRMVMYKELKLNVDEKKTAIGSEGND